MTQLTILSPGGEQFDMVGFDSPFRIERGGIEGLSGSSEDLIVELPGGGQINRGIRLLPMTGVIRAYVVQDGRDDTEHKHNVARLRAAWSRTQHTTLTLEDDTGYVYNIRLRLSDAIPAPEREHGYSNITRVELPVVCDDGFWTRATSSTDSQPVWNRDEHSYTYTYDVVNTGDMMIYPTLELQDDNNTTTGGKVALINPSGATMVFDDDIWGSTINFDPTTGFAIRNRDGVINTTLWDKYKSTILPEGIPVGGARVYRVMITGIDNQDDTPTVIMHHNTRVLDPWR